MPILKKDKKMTSDYISLTDIFNNSKCENRKKPALFIRRFREFLGHEIIVKSGRYYGGTWASPRITEYYKKWIIDDSNDLLDIRTHCQKESAALATIEQIKGVTLNRQFAVLGYRIDGYDESNNIAYEIDESHHNTPQNMMLDNIRQKEIISVLKCEFIRIKV